MRILDRSMFRKPVESEEDYHAREYMKQKGWPNTPAHFDRAKNLVLKASYYIPYFDIPEASKIASDIGNAFTGKSESPEYHQTTPGGHILTKDEMNEEGLALQKAIDEEPVLLDPPEEISDAESEEELVKSGETPIRAALEAAGVEKGSLPEQEILQSVKESPEVRKSFAEELGIDVSNPYDTWAYIRDMSAGLLASDEPTFLGAWGEAALMSNKNRKEANKENRLLKAKLALTKWENEEKKKAADLKYGRDVDIATLKASIKKPKNPHDRVLSSITENGITYETIESDQPPAPGSGIQFIPTDNGKFVFVRPTNKRAPENRKRMVELSDKLSDRINSPEVFDRAVRTAGYGTIFKGKPLYDFAKNEKYEEARAALKGKSKEVLEKYADAVDEGNAEDATDYLRQAQILPQLGPAMQKHFEQGVITELSAYDRDMIAKLTQKKALELMNEVEFGGERTYTVDDFLRPALQYVLDNANWDMEGRDRYRMDLTREEIEQGYRTWKQHAGVAPKPYDAPWWSWDALNAAEYPEGHPGASITEDPFRKAGDIGMINMNQFEMLPAHIQSQLNADMITVARNVRQFNPNVTEEEIRNKFLTAVIVNNSLHGGEDTWGKGSDVPSKYSPPKAKMWHVEPQKIVKKGKSYKPESLFKDFDMAWDGFRGQWFRVYEDNGTRQIQWIGADELKQQGFTMPTPKQVSFRERI